MRNVALIFIAFIYLSSCSSGSNGNDFWMLLGFPLLGLSYFVGRIAHEYFQRNVSPEKQDNDPQPFPLMIVGAIIIGGIILLFKIIF